MPLGVHSSKVLKLKLNLQEPLTHMAPNGNGAARTALPRDMATLCIGRPAQTNPTEVTRNGVNMYSEDDRLKTFTNWPVRFLNKSTLAAAGFYYLNKDDVVRCAYCGVEIGQWEEGDNPLEDHKRWSSSCPFLRRLSGNVSKAAINSLQAARHNKMYDVCGLYGNQICPNSGPENGKKCPQHLLEQLSINKYRGPTHSSYISVDIRMKSFETWPKSLKQRPQELSEAGFFYSGQGDQTYCFYCGGGLKDWKPSDDPWTEHGKWFPKCTYVILVKGKEFIQKVSTEADPLILSEDIQKMNTVNKEEHETSVEKAGSSKLSIPTETPKKPLDEGRLCKICFQEELGVVFLPCGHLVACVKCAPSLSTCAICRKPFTATVRAFLS